MWSTIHHHHFLVAVPLPTLVQETVQVYRLLCCVNAKCFVLMFEIIQIASYRIWIRVFTDLCFFHTNQFPTLFYYKFPSLKISGALHTPTIAFKICHLQPFFTSRLGLLFQLLLLICSKLPYCFMGTLPDWKQKQKKTYMQIIWVLGPECFNITAIYKLEPKYKSPTSRNNQHIICINDSSHVSNSETGTTRIREHWFCLGYGLPIWIYENWSIFRKDFPQITCTSWICFEKSSRHVNEWIFIYFTEILTLHKIRPGKSDYRVAKDTPPPLLSLSARICSIMSACATFIVTLANICAASQEDNNQRFHLCD